MHKLILSCGLICLTAFILLIQFSSFSIAYPVRYAQSTALKMNQAIDVLTQKIIADVTSNQKRKAAVLNFLNIDGKSVDIGNYVAEEITTRIFSSKKFMVVERTLLSKLLKEQGFTQTGFVDPSTAAKMGKLLGVDVLISGTVADLGTSVKVNARMIETQTGEIFAVASVEMQKDEQVLSLMKQTIAIAIANNHSNNSASNNSSNQSNAGGTLWEDFSKYDIGDSPKKYGDGFTIRRSNDGKTKYAYTNVPGRKSFKFDLNFPTNFVLEFWGHKGGYYDTCLALKLTDSNDNQFILGNAGYSAFQVTGTSPVNLSNQLYSSDKWHHYTIKHKDDVIKFYIDDNFIMSSDSSQYSRFTQAQIIFTSGCYPEQDWENYTSQLSITKVRVAPLP